MSAPHLDLLAAVAERAHRDATEESMSEIAPARRPAVAMAARDWLKWAVVELAPVADLETVTAGRGGRPI